MIKVLILGQGMVANHFAVGLERIKSGELEPYGVPLANYSLKYSINDIEIVASYDVDLSKIGKSIYEIASKYLDNIPIPNTLRDIIVRKGVHLGSLRGLPIEVAALDNDNMSLNDIKEYLIDEWEEVKPDVIVNIINTEHCRPFKSLEELNEAVESNKMDRFSASQFYAYTACEYAKRNNNIAFINVVPTPLANDDVFIKLFESANSVVFGDDGATGATPLTADLLAHLHSRNRRIKSIVQFNIGGNLDFLSLTIPERNIMKETTKSSIVQDILGYDVPCFIKPTGYLEPLGDKKFVSMHIEYINFNGLTDEMFINYRINDSPSLAGLLVDLVRLGKIALERGLVGTVYEINAFYMKKPGPPNAKSIPKIIAFENLLKFLGLKS